MKCSRIALSLLIAATSGAVIAVGPAQGHLGMAAVVGPDFPAYMAPLRQEGNTFLGAADLNADADQQADTATAADPAGMSQADMEAENYYASYGYDETSSQPNDAAAPSATTSDDTVDTRYEAESADRPSQEFEYDYGYKYGYQRENGYESYYHRYESAESNEAPATSDAMPAADEQPTADSESSYGEEYNQQAAEYENSYRGEYNDQASEYENSYRDESNDQTAEYESAASDSAASIENTADMPFDYSADYSNEYSADYSAEDAAAASTDEYRDAPAAEAMSPADESTAPAADTTAPADRSADAGYSYSDEYEYSNADQKYGTSEDEAEAANADEEQFSAADNTDTDSTEQSMSAGEEYDSSTATETQEDSYNYDENNGEETFSGEEMPAETATEPSRPDEYQPYYRFNDENSEESAEGTSTSAMGDETPAETMPNEFAPADEANDSADEADATDSAANQSQFEEYQPYNRYGDDRGYEPTDAMTEESTGDQSSSEYTPADETTDGMTEESTGDQSFSEYTPADETTDGMTEESTGDQSFSEYTPADETTDGMTEDSTDATGDVEANDEATSSEESDTANQWMDPYESASSSDQSTVYSTPTVDLDSWLPSELLTAADQQLIRDLAQSFEENEEVRKTILNDYLETLGWDAKRLASKFEENADVEVLGLNNDLPTLAALLATVRLMERGELTLEEGVNLLCHDLGGLSEQWVDGVDEIATEESQDSTMPVTAPNTDGGQTDGQTNLLDVLRSWSVESIDSTTVALRTAIEQITTLGRHAIIQGLEMQRSASLPSFDADQLTF